LGQQVPQHDVVRLHLRLGKRLFIASQFCLQASAGGGALCCHIFGTINAEQFSHLKHYLWTTTFMTTGKIVDP
jgi:hypothetical protein